MEHWNPFGWLLLGGGFLYGVVISWIPVFHGGPLLFLLRLADCTEPIDRRAAKPGRTVSTVVAESAPILRLKRFAGN